MLALDNDNCRRLAQASWATQRSCVSALLRPGVDPARTPGPRLDVPRASGLTMLKLPADSVIQAAVDVGRVPGRLRQAAGAAVITAEAAGLAWLRGCGCAHSPGDRRRGAILTLSAVPQHPTADMTHRFGEQLARTHGAGAAAFVRHLLDPRTGLDRGRTAFGGFPTLRADVRRAADRALPPRRASRSERLGRTDADAIEATVGGVE